jgi:hypothetical protein
MTISDDFGYAAIKWEQVNAANVRLVEGEYRERLTGAIAAWNDLDGKARFLFSGLVGIVTAIVAALLFCAAMLVACAILPRPYAYPGVTPADLDVSAWSPLLLGDEKQAFACRASASHNTRRISSRLSARTMRKESGWLGRLDLRSRHFRCLCYLR